jgi:hypothetical protein
MEGGPVHGILGRDAELAEVKSFLGSGSGGPRPCSRRERPGSAFANPRGTEPGVIPYVPDAVEALVSLGRLDEAEGLVDRLERQGRTCRELLAIPQWGWVREDRPHWRASAGP